ncbi:flavin reductase family protein [Sutterella sp.]|uniref:flavin reductase family protein n=1 Tax=Sutterella sp. TaxID=1981025 RepID=UPI0026DFE7FD|nr:flavin reductase [Sutterella sp.]MDO5532843.1 flavin reductase [Sutterella sp.]
MLPEFFEPVPADKAYRLFNLGATPLVSASFEGVDGVMPATWVCPLDLVPFKTTAVIARDHFTRPLMEKSGRFALSLPTASIVEETLRLGFVSKNDDPLKLEHSGAEFFRVDGFDVPLVKGCACWAIFDIIPEAHNQQTYDLFIGTCVGAWADPRVFSNGHWNLEGTPKALRPLHYVAGGHFYATGDPVVVPGYDGE